MQIVIALEIFMNACSYAGNAELYSKVGVPFVMGTTGGDRDLLHKTVLDSNIYAVISPQMGKQVYIIISENLDQNVMFLSLVVCHPYVAILFFL